MESVDTEFAPWRGTLPAAGPFEGQAHFGKPFAQRAHGIILAATGLGERAQRGFVEPAANHLAILILQHLHLALRVEAGDFRPGRRADADGVYHRTLLA